MPAPAGLDAATIGAIQNMLGLSPTMQWDAITEAAFNNFQTQKGWGAQFGLTGNAEEWALLVDALQRKDTTPSRTMFPGDGARQPTRTDAPATPTGPTQQQQSARAHIEQQLRSWGLESLTDYAWGEILNGNGELLPSLIRNTEQYKQRFAGNEARRAAGLNVLSEGEYLTLENNYREIMHSYGIPRGVFDTQGYLANLISNDLSPRELNDRLRIYQDAAFNAPAEVRDALTRLYGVSQGALTAYFIDPERALPALQQQYQAAGAASAAARAGFGELGVATAERVAQLGGSADSVSTFANLRQSRELFTGLGFQQGPAFTDDQATVAAFGGDALTADVLEQRGRERAAEFAGGGSFAQTQKGVTGLGGV